MHGEVENPMGQLQLQKEYFPGLTIWWDRLHKRKVRQIFQREQAERRRDHRMMQNHLYECIMMYCRDLVPATKRYL